MNVLMGGLSQVKRVPWMASGIYIASSGGCKCEVWLSGDLDLLGKGRNQGKAKKASRSDSFLNMCKQLKVVLVLYIHARKILFLYILLLLFTVSVSRL